MKGQAASEKRNCHLPGWLAKTGQIVTEWARCCRLESLVRGEYAVSCLQNQGVLRPEVLCWSQSRGDDLQSSQLSGGLNAHWYGDYDRYESLTRPRRCRLATGFEKGCELPAVNKRDEGEER